MMALAWLAQSATTILSRHLWPYLITSEHRTHSSWKIFHKRVNTDFFLLTFLATPSAKMATNGVINGEMAQSPHELFDTILVLDFGSQYTHLITRRLRELNVYSEMLPCTQKLRDLDFTPKGIILSGGPYSVYSEDAPHVDEEVFKLDVPILGICYGLQELAWHHGKGVAAGEKREFGKATLQLQKHAEKSAHIDQLFEGLENEIAWMSHGDKVSRLPKNFHTIASTSNAPFAGIAHDTKNLFGIQFHPEVSHTPKGIQLIKNFAVGICKAQTNWTMKAFVDEEVARIRTLVGDKAQVIGAVSGGVDSTVAAKLMETAIGE